MGCRAPIAVCTDLKFSGAALGGLTPRILSVLESVNGKLAAALIPHSILGLMSQYPKMHEEFNKQIKTQGPRNATGFLAAQKFAFKESVFVYMSQSIFDYFKDGKDVLQIPNIAEILAKNEMGNYGVPQMPLLVYKAIKDEISKIQDTDDLVDKYCKAGTNILYERNTVGNHPQEDSLGFPKALEWLSTVFDGTYNKTYSSQGCTIRDVTVTRP
jgi:hypothetical protein